MSKNKNKSFSTNNESEITMGSSLNNLTSSDATSSYVTSSAVTSSSSYVSALKSDAVIKSATNTVKVATPATTTAAKATEVNPNVAKLEKLLKDYEDALEQMKTDSNKFKSMDVMISICEYLNRNNDPAVFETFFRYFQRHQNDIMYYETALRGIHLVQNKMVKTRVSSTHACYLELCRVRSLKSGTFKFTINAMKLMYISETQGKWIIAKSTNRQ